MEKKEAVIKVLKEHGCQSSKQIACSCKRLFDFDITPAGVGGVLRGLVSRGLAASSNCGNGVTVYWLMEGEDK